MSTSSYLDSGLRGILTGLRLQHTLHFGRSQLQHGLEDLSELSVVTFGSKVRNCLQIIVSAMGPLAEMGGIYLVSPQNMELLGVDAIQGIFLQSSR